MLNTLPMEYEEISTFIVRVGSYTFDTATKLLIEEEKQMKEKSVKRNALLQ